ncbi:sulfotransferase [Ideonella sp.]|uniref:sulfotransferase n=1 Tax=Ideonella sp. TaxID=1929293 RepID=UPI002B4836EA|nr:sulfotransferase [Ideonella sp.]HJV68785.1 sulfotransferase [Ideonella sp.]
MGDTRAPFLLLAHHRSGSNLLNDLLQAHPCIECLNEPFSMHTPFFREHDLQPWAAGDFEPSRLHRHLPDGDDLRPFLHAFRDYLECSCAQRVIGFKETGLFGKLGWLQAFMPRLKLILLWREPRAIVSSVLRSGLIDFWDYRELVPPAFRRLFPQAPPPRGAMGSREELAGLAAMSVATRYELARRALPGFEHLVVGLDDVVQRPGETLGALARFLGVAPHPGPLQFLQGRQVASRGGTFSSVREPQRVTQGWQQHLGPSELAAIEHVLAVAGWHDPAAVWARRGEWTKETTPDGPEDADPALSR